MTIGDIMKQLAQAFATPFEGSGPAKAVDAEAARRRWDRN